MNENNSKKFWGPAIWRTIHSQAVTYQPHRAEHYKQFINTLPYLLPCAVCQKHLAENLKQLPLEPYLTSNHNLFFWTYLLHDRINTQLGKKSPPFNDIKAEYFKALSDECANCQL